MDLVETPTRQLTHQRGQVDLALRIGQGQDLAAAVEQFADLARLGIDARMNDQHARALEQFRLEIDLEPRVDQHLHRLARRATARRSSGIVIAHRADPGEDRAGAGTPAVTIVPRRLGGDPLAAAVGQGGAPVEGGSSLEPGPRAARATSARRNPMFSSVASCCSRPPADIDAGCAQTGRAPGH
jgi:hypothetical protein